MSRSTPMSFPILAQWASAPIAFARISAPGLGDEHVRAVRRGLQKLHEFFIERGHSLIRGQHAIFRNESREQIRRPLGLFHADDADLQIGEVRSAGRRLLTGRKQRYGYGQNRETKKRRVSLLISRDSLWCSAPRYL